MKPSKALCILLFGVVIMTHPSMAEGTQAGTKITNRPTLNYSMGGENRTVNAPESSYVVDKILNFTVDLQKAKEQSFVIGHLVWAEFIVTNKGNSAEDFVLEGSYGRNREFSFNHSKIYIDKNDNGILDNYEKVDTPVLTKLGMDKKKRIWIEMKSSSSDNLIGKKSEFGLKIQASASGVDGIYKSESQKNNISKVDIVFADGGRDEDAVRNNTAVNRYLWKASSVATVFKVDKTLIFNHISADPLHGVAKNRQEAEKDNFQPLSRATRVKIWEVKNSSKGVGENIKVSIPIDKSVERISTTSAYTWWREKDKRVHIILDEKSNRIIGEGVYNPNTASIDFNIKRIGAGEKLYLHVVTVLTKSLKVGRLEIKNVWNIISADPVNGVCKDASDAKSGKFKAIPGATAIRSWEIINNTSNIAKDVKFSIKLNPKVERVATTSKNTWWKNDNRVHLISLEGKGNIGEGIYHANSNAVEFFFKEIKVGEKYHSYIVTEIK